MNIKPHIAVSSDEFIFGLLVLFISAFLVAESRWSRLNSEQAIASDSPYHLYLDKKTDLAELSDSLIQAGIVKSREELRWAAELLGWKRFREGHYLIDQKYTYDAFLSKLARGIQDPVSVTILPGKDMGSIAAMVSKNMQFDSLSFRKVLTDSTILSAGKVDTHGVIGRLYPNTYSLFWTATPKKVFKRILNEFEKAVINPHKAQFKTLDYSIDEIITLASIVEWEAKSKAEQATISGLYWNRLKRGMRLQADPTVNFAIGERRRLLYEDYRIDHPYNTYQYRGLPPGPITNPSLDAIKATLYPEEHDYLYMVASPDGSHAFSKTFEEHKRKSAKWRKWLQKQYRIKEKRKENSR
ncbi:endolytic transglycosylase MltG [Fodinibius halophilus]|uniref:Endolytic murein transglycosylase n=1 Tax=Fodinibius halophilus TaxID=1736908 RepID=A0A6M1TCD0_9BACT|nr:endolytic transglycosylase MltG [Fodinibius halophilus]NGP87882.1 endolytic transglycosylase MltG [Fodinibius halophilus]